MRHNLNYIKQTGMPRFRGFNLLQKFRYDNGGKAVVFERPNMPFEEEDFALIRELGFDFARLPLDYLCWSDQDNWKRIDEATMQDLDQAVEFGRQYGVHVCINFHRAPGYCINPPAEKRNVFKDPEALEAFCYHWAAFARRYKGVPGSRLSFNLINEPHNTNMPDFMTRADFLRVMNGECGCLNKTPHDVVLAWFEDLLKILTTHNIGYALWNFKGPFGILNSNRADVKYEDFHGHNLDRKLLELLRRY
jgi:endoglucanase